LGACASGPPKREGRIEGLPLERRGISAYFQNTLCDKTASFQCISLPCVVARNQLHFCAAAGASPGPLLLQCTVGSTSHRLTFARFPGLLELRSRPVSPPAPSFVQWLLPHKRSPPGIQGAWRRPTSSSASTASSGKFTCSTSSLWLGRSLPAHHMPTCMTLPHLLCSPCTRNGYPTPSLTFT
jgi:hypothetical protein